MESKQQVKDFQELYYHYSKRTWEWEPYMRKYGCKNICEVGVRNGTNFDYLIKHKPDLAIAVDAWLDDGTIGNNDMCYPQDVMNKQYEGFKERMKDKPFVEIIRGYSSNAVKQFTDNFFDFVYIDANHTFEGCYRDIFDWYRKVKSGGTIAGHDFERRHVRTKRGKIKFGVVEAVERFAKENNLEYHILKPNVWMMIKK